MSNQSQHSRSNERDAVIGNALQRAESDVVVDRADLDRRREALLGWMNELVETDPDSGAELPGEANSMAAFRKWHTGPEPARVHSHGVPGMSGRVLVVDDNKVIRQLIRVNLELEGFEVVTATDGLECLQIAHQVQPDLVLLDVIMPQLDGMRTAAQLRAGARTRDLPVVVSAATEYELEATLKLGVDAFLPKPFEPAELVRLVRQFSVPKGDEASQPTGEGTSRPEHPENAPQFLRTGRTCG